MMKNILSSVAISALLAGCTLSPKYERPESPVSGSYPGGQTAGDVSAADIEWQNFFDDARLKKLIALSLENNRDLRIATLRVEQSRAQYRIQRSALFPNLDASASLDRRRTPDTLSPTGRHTTDNVYDVSVGAAFELDLFGRVRSLKEDALQRYFAIDESRKSVQIALVFRSRLAVFYHVAITGSPRSRARNSACGGRLL